MNTTKPSAFIGSFLLVFALLLCGCPDKRDAVVLTQENALTEEQLLELANRPLRVLCLGAEVWADEMKAQYSGRFDNKIEIVTESTSDYQKRDPATYKDFDVLIIPPNSVPSLAEDRILFEIRPESLERIDEQSLLTIDRDFVRYGKGTYGVSLGTPLRVLYRSDTKLAARYLAGSNTWEQWHSMATEANKESLQFIETMSGTGAAEALLNRGGAYARSRTQVAMYLNKTSGEARINTEPFVTALTEMKEEYGSHVDKLKTMTPLEAFQAIETSTATALLTPILNLNFVDSASKSKSDAAKEKVESGKQAEQQVDLSAFGTSGLQSRNSLPTLSGWGIASVPASNRYFNFFSEQWADRADSAGNRFQLVGLHGRVACILRNTRKTESALRFLSLLTNSPTAESIAPLGQDIGPAKNNQLDQVATWFGKRYPAEALESIRTAYQMADESQGVSVLTFPGTDDHHQRIQLLNQTVLDVLAGTMEPQTALNQCAQKWDEFAAKGKNRVKKLLELQ